MEGLELVQRSLDTPGIRQEPSNTQYLHDFIGQIENVESAIEEILLRPRLFRV